MQYELSYTQYSECSILITWPSKIDEKVFQDIIFYKKCIENEEIKEIVEVITAYNSILIYYGHTIENVYSKVLVLKTIYGRQNTISASKHKLWKIPVCYDDEVAPDLNSFADQKSLHIDELISLHTAPLYRVYFLGFLPGFCYLGGLDDRLAIPRKTTPRRKVQKGAVAIGGNQTGIYPVDSPGGWYIIGSCPLDFFDPTIDPPCVFSSGDYIQFISIKVFEYTDIKSKVAANNFVLNYTYI